MKLSTFLHKRLVDLLDERRIVVWYDAEHAFEEFVGSFNAPNCMVVSAAESILRARRRVDEVYHKMNESENSSESRANLLIYVPRPRGTTEEWMEDAFAVFAVAGTAMGDKDEDRLESLARRAMPDRTEEIARLFAEAEPTLALLDGLEAGERYPLLREALSSESPTEIAAVVLCDDAKAGQVGKVSGAQEELLRLLEADFGFKPPARVRSLDKIRASLATYILFSEFVFDLPIDLPDSFSAVVRAESRHKDRVFAACDRMRSDAGLREGYVEIATRGEAELRLAEQMADETNLGTRDTFAFEERRYLRALIDAVKGNRLDEAGKIIEERKHSVWRDRPERAMLWTAAARCVDFLESADRVAGVWREDSDSVKRMVEAYTRPNGWYELDRRQRLFEHSAASCSEHEEIQPIVELCRKRYREVALAVQERFLQRVEQDGWPPEGVLRQTQIFDKHAAPPLEEKEKVAFFLVDSLRYEMGCDIRDALSVLGECEVSPALALPPTSTPFGMAALLPGADAELHIVEKNGELFPAIGTRLLKNVNDRMKMLAEKYGDRFVHVTLDDLISKFKRHESKLKTADLLVVRSQDVDQIAENLGEFKARKYLSEVLPEIVTVARRVAELGYTRLVLAADHGHILLSEIPPGDVVQKPAGEWLLAKRRCCLGHGTTVGDGTLVIKADRVGISGDVEELCVPRGFKVFSAGEAYFHEGLSLQEAVVPVIIVHARVSAAMKADASIELRYRSNKFTSRVIGMKLVYSSLFPDPVQVRVDAYDGSTAKANKVGEAADCEMRDEATHHVTLKPTVETQVPVLLDSEFSGSKIEIRVIDPQTEVVWAKCELRNAMLD